MTKAKLLITLIALLTLTGCANMPACIKAAGQDTANVHFTITTVYGTLTYDRANPGTNPIAVGPNGITTKP